MDVNRPIRNPRNPFSRLGRPGNASGGPPNPGVARRGRGRAGRHDGNWRPYNRGDDENRNRPYERNRRGNQERNSRARPERAMGFKYLQNLVENNDIDQVILDLFNDRNGFANLLDSKEISNDMIVLLVKLLWNVCGSSFYDVKIKMLSTVLNSRFMDKLTLFVMNITNQSPRDKFSNKYFWNDTDEFWNCLIKLCKTVQEFIPTYCELVQKLLKNMTIFFPLIENQHSIHISDEIKAQTASVLDIVERTINDLEVKRKRIEREIPFEEDMEPPDDFHQIEIVPSAQEVVTEESPFLRANIVDRPYSSVNQYLDIQFRLLREDFVAPLRRGVCTYLRNESKPKKEWKKLDSIKIYNPVRFICVENVNECNCYRIMFDFSRKKRTFTYENSKRFMFGSLVCFTKDNFKELLFGKIVDRDVKLLEQGLLVVGFRQETPVDFESDYLMVESSVYFEPYYQVLGVLQRMDADTFPMKKYIIDVKTDSRPPAYLLKVEPVVYRVENREFFSLNIPDRRFFNFNDSQLSAYKAALTDEFCIIQGPPGTGKTYLGLRIAQTLLENQHAWYKHTPILVICYTNHALDQFLEGLLPVTENVLRVGGRSKNEALTKYNLVHRRRNVAHRAAVLQKKREVRDSMEYLKTLRHVMSEIEANESLISFKSFSETVENFNRTWFYRANDDDIKKWLLEGKDRPEQRREQMQVQEPAAVQDDADMEDEPLEGVDLQDDHNAEELDDIFSGIVATGHTPLLTLRQLRAKLADLQNQLNMLPNENDLRFVLLRERLLVEIYETETDLDYLDLQLHLSQDPQYRRKPRHMDLRDPSKMRYADRWRLYFYWLDLYVEHLRRRYIDCGNTFRETFRLYSDMRDIQDTQLMKEHLVVGMTTTGAARLQSSLQGLRSPIVIVEEAAEVLEAHIVAALTNYCTHLILIGDHLQLKPGAADYRIETRFNLGISLFERMVRNEIKCHTLTVQHRMRPEISKLVKPHIYPNLEDHESTLQRPPILGVDKCLYFIDHQEREELCQDASKKNVHESKFLIALARHLVLNGYKPEQITILAAYLGQYFQMVREKKNPSNRMFLQDVRISVLDNYQGEESDIILLSLVRSNSENKAGFLRIQNRVCVALSRARDGFYIMGNMSLLLNSESENEIWEKVKAVLDEQHAIGTHLTLRCQVHPYKLTQVSSGDDFVKLSEGGCDLMCEAQIACGHVCKRLCHVIDRDHNSYKCNEKCTRVLCNDASHVCQKLCYEECGLCMYLVSRDLDCGHIVKIECYIDVAKYKCLVLVDTKLPCDHETRIPCSADPKTFRCPFPCDIRVEPCGHGCSRSCHVRADPDHLKYTCMERCGKPRIGCKKTEDQHPCTRLCFQSCEDCMVGVKKQRSCGHVFKIACMNDVEDEKCERPCKKILPCGHPCKSKCCETCGPCAVLVEKIVPECQHTVKIRCHLEPERQYCKNASCPRLLSCGHKCTRPCRLPCTEECTEKVDCDIKAPCGHILKNIICHIKATNDPKMLLKYCTQPCGIELKCKHKCSGTCGDCMQSRVHVRCTEKCGVPLVCNHECPIPCREACKPCTQACRMRCVHNKCKKKCGEPCTSCKSECTRRCKHQRCTRKCGEMCDVQPCDKRCEKVLRCGHECVGFCGDPCPPLCRICNKEELTEIFLGFEDNEDAIYVLLNDCKHVLESVGLEGWMNQGKDQIQFKTCPKCKANIMTTQRYSEHVKQAMLDVITAKEKSYGELKENEILREQLTAELIMLRESCADKHLLLFVECPKLTNTFETLLTRLKASSNNRRQAVNKIELNAIRSKIQTLEYIMKCFSEIKKRIIRTDPAIVHLNMLLDVLLRSDDHITDQEVDDLEKEIKRLHRIVQFDIIQKNDLFKNAQTNPAVKVLIEDVQQVLFLEKRYTDLVDNALKQNLQELAGKIDFTLTISDKERMEIVKAMGFSKGHWYKCPNGHPYAIDNCGFANQASRCLCGAPIGGTSYRLLPNNQLAGEMVGASRPAYQGGLY